MNPVKIWREKHLPCHPLGFEFEELPGQIFKIVVPELVSDGSEAQLPWDYDGPQEWDIQEKRASCSAKIPEKILTDVEVIFKDERIVIDVKVTNLSDRAWHNVNVFTCFAFYDAPEFDNPELDRIFIPILKNGWKPISELFKATDPGDGPYTFFKVENAPVLDEFWISRFLKQRHPEIVVKGSICVISKDGDWTIKMSAEPPAYVFNNRRERCIHADPLLGDIQPGQTKNGRSVVHFFNGNPYDL